MPDARSPRKPGPRPTPRRKTSLLLTAADEANIAALEEFFGTNVSSEVIRRSLELAVQISRVKPKGEL